MSAEAEIIRSALEGDATAFDRLIRGHQDRLYRAMVQVIGSAEDAEDIVQEAFVRAFLKLHTFQQNCQFFTWLYRIAFNLVVCQYRKRRAELSVEVIRELGGFEPVDTGAPPDARLLRDEDIAFVQEALRKLSDDHRAILVLREIEDCSYEQISTILEVSIGTVRSRLSRARTQLRIAMEQMRAEQPF